LYAYAANLRCAAARFGHREVLVDAPSGPPLDLIVKVEVAGWREIQPVMRPSFAM